MSTSSLKYFRVNGVAYHHWIDTGTDSTHVTNGAEEILYTVNADCGVFDRAGKIGVFRTDSDRLWYFKGVSGVKIETGKPYLIDAELVVFKHFLEG